MNREEFAKVTRWDYIIAAVGLLNVFVFFPYLWDLYTTHDVSAVKLTSFLLALLIQVCYAVEGFIRRSPGVMYVQIICAVQSVAVLVGYLIFMR